MNAKKTSYTLFIFVAIHILFINPIIAQYRDAQTFLKDNNIKPTVIQLKRNGIKVPAGGHLQGIQCIADSLLLITASSGSYSYYLVACINQKNHSGRLVSIHKIMDSPFRHAGGCQVYGNTLAVGVEDNEKKDESDIMLISFDDSGRETGRHTIAHRQGAVKRSTAGAVGFTKTKTGQYMMVAGDWDSKNLDVYLSRPGNDTLFDSLTTFTLPFSGKLPSYQSLNLFTDTSGKIYLLGFSLFGTQNRVDLFQLDFSKGSVAVINKGVFAYHCKHEAGFRYGSGIGVANDQSVTIYSCGRGTRPFTAVNILGK